MQRSKQRKLINTLPKGMPEGFIQEALGKINNQTSRAKVESRIRRRAGAR